jgi:hypothetical protein
MQTERSTHRWQPHARQARVCAAVMLGLLWIAPHATAQPLNTPSASTTLYVRTDSDRTTVVTPRLHVGTPLSDATRIDLVYTADVWTSASVDIRTSASKRLGDNQQYQAQKPVTEQRDEINLSVVHAFTDLRLTGSYRYSKEHDYESHGGTLGGAYDFADHSATLALGARAYFDQVGRAGDPWFIRDASTLGLLASYTQVIDTKTFAQLIYDVSRQQGYLSNPYRYVRIATDAGQVPSTCIYQAAAPGGKPVTMCVPERNPDLRMRHAVAVQARRALSQTLSLGASYRLYLDDWQITSHTAAVDAAWMPSRDWLLSLGYRFYHQSGASHYAPFYLPTPMPEHFTSDKELSSLSSHRLELELTRTFSIDDLDSQLRLVLRISPAYYRYPDFPLLRDMRVLEVTASTEVTL